MSRIGKEARRGGRAAWLVPLIIFLVTAGGTAGVLATLYNKGGFNFFERPAPTDSTDAVAVTLGGTGFHIPASYVVYASARRGGREDELEMMALLPDLQGYSLADAAAFASQAPDSRVVNFTLREERRTLSDQERLDHSYLPLVENKEGTSGAYGLTAYKFRPNSGYDGHELYVGGTPGGMVILRCETETDAVPAPECECWTSISEELSLTYRYRRAHLDQWRDIDAGIRALAGAFMDVAPKDVEPKENGEATSE